MSKSKHEETLDAVKSAIKALEVLDEEQQKQAIRTITQLLGHAGVAGPNSDSSVGGTGSDGNLGGTPDITKMTPKAFLKTKKPVSDAERVTCLAYYLTHARDTQHFKTADITKLNTEAAQPALSNTTVAVDNATRSNQYLAIATGGKKQITPLGEAVVEALPNQDTVKTAIAEHGKRRRRKKAKKNS